MLTTIKDGTRLIVVWLGLAFLAGIVAMQLYSLAIVTSWVMIQSDTFRPPGWSSVTVSGVSRFVVFLVGAVWLLFVTFLESLLRSWEKNNILTNRSLRLAGLLLATAVICFLFNQIIGNL